MYFNNTLTRVKVKTTIDSFGYKTSKFTKTKDIYKADVQPYSKELLRKEYGIDSDFVAYRCFLLDNKLQLSDYVNVNDNVYMIIFLHCWDTHTEIVLGEVKNGQKH